MRIPSRLVNVALCALSLVATWAASPAFAQGRSSNAAAPQEGEEMKGDAAVAEIHEVERGLYASVDVGANYYLNLSGASFVNLNEGWVRPGTRLGLRVGYDVLNNVNVELFFLANFNKNKLNTDAIAAGQLTGDIAQFTPGIGGRFAFITTKRLFVFARGGLGYAFWAPKELAGGSLGSVHLDASVGVEYYTFLRHLSVGAEVSVQTLLLPFAVGFQVYPTIKYTF